jgi:hypothetical protein
MFSSPLQKMMTAILLAATVIGCGKGGSDDTSSTATDTGPTVDSDYDGWADFEDCDPNDPYTYPGADDIPYDGKDNDCCCEVEGEDSECCGDLVDWDGDGFIATNAGGDDCNDGNPNIYPGAAEVCYDGIDQDCMGDVDSDDCDGDGYDRYSDCDDENPEAYPGASEIWYDGEDGDCSGPSVSDYDQDYDGQDHEDYGGTDCDDTDPESKVGGTELWDTIDRDCDGKIDEMNQRDATGYWTGDVLVSDGFIGFGAGLLGDLDGDGFGDFAISGIGGETDSNGGVAYIVSGGQADGSFVDSAILEIDGTSNSYFGWDLAVIDDLNGDSYPELLVGAPAFNEARLYSGIDLMGPGPISEAVILSGGTFVGADVANIGDIDNDGYVEMSIGVGIVGEAYVEIFAGNQVGSSSGTFSSSIATISGSGVGGLTVGGLDYNGDGVVDMLMGEGAWSSEDGLPADGMTSVISGADIGGSMSTSNFPSLTGSSASGVGSFNGWLADVDNNGYDEVVVSAPFADNFKGAVYVVDGSVISGSQTAADVAMFTVNGSLANGYLKGADEGGYFDSDSSIDLVVSAVGDFIAYSQNVTQGETHVFFGHEIVAGGSVSASDSSVTFSTTEADSLWGYQVVGGDINSDGLDDLLITAPAATSYTGGAAIFLSGLE